MYCPSPSPSPNPSPSLSPSASVGAYFPFCMTWETENSHQRTNPPNGLCSSMSLFCFKSHAIVNSGGVVSGMSGSVFQKNKRRRINWRIKAAEKHWLKQVISQKFEDLF